MIKRLAGIVFGALVCIAASAQSIEDRIRELERRVEQLEKQVAQPTSSMSAPKPVAIQSDGWRQKENWRALKRGMTEKDVRSILGEPEQVQSFRSFSVWRYPGMSDAKFDRDGRLDGWSEPW